MNIKVVVLSLLLALSCMCLRAQVVTSDVMPGGRVPGPIHADGIDLVNSYGFPIDESTSAYYFSDKQCNEYFKARSSARVGCIITCIGAGIVGIGGVYWLSSSLSNKPYGQKDDSGSEVLKSCLIISVPFLAIGIPMNGSAKRDIKNLAADYNESIKEHSSYMPSLTVGGTAHGIGIALNF